jgi:uncharacterized protein (DUF1778 family)
MCESAVQGFKRFTIASNAESARIDLCTSPKAKALIERAARVSAN